jgi:hypothetical protein
MAIYFSVLGRKKNENSQTINHKLSSIIEVNNDTLTIETNNSSVSKEKRSKSQKSNIIGLWRIDCGNALTTLDISNSDAYISIYSNTVFINAHLESIPNEDNNYYIKFLNQEDTYESTGNKIDAESISKEKSIGKLEFKNNKLLLYWYGLFNEKTKRLEYDKNTPFDIEGENKKPSTLTKCE